MYSLIPFLLVGLLIVNLISFGLMWYDKRCARRGRWRIPESVLFIACICFGGIGGVLGMKLLRHKTRHWNFRFFFPLILFVQVVVLMLLFVHLL